MRVWEGRRFAVEVEDGYEIADTPDAVPIVARCSNSLQG
jgi:hypothetical protein